MTQAAERRREVFVAAQHETVRRRGAVLRGELNRHAAVQVRRGETQPGHNAHAQSGEDVLLDYLH